MFFIWSGSEVPVIENRIKYYTKINENIKKLGIKYINHLYRKNHIWIGTKEKSCIKERIYRRLVIGDNNGKANISIQ